MALSNFSDEVFIKVTGFLDITLLFFEHCVFDRELDKVASVVSTYACLTILELGPSQCYILEASLYKVHV